MPAIGKVVRRAGVVFPDEVRFGDIVHGLPVPDGSVRGVFASHVLEHLSLQDFWVALKNTFRLLEPEGVFRLVVPDLEARARSYIQKVDAQDVEANSWFMHSTCLGMEIRKRGAHALARQVFGHSAHLWMWDEMSLRAALAKVGFTKIRRCKFNDCHDKAFCMVEDITRFYDASIGIEECAMEAITPKRSR